MKGKIIKGIGGFYYIKTEEGLIECKARGKFRHRDMKPMVGDDVEIIFEGSKGVIENIYDRSSELIRPTVANVTQAFVVFSIKNPDINFDLLNRFLVLCEHNNIHAIVCLNKVDLVSDEEKEEIRIELLNGIGNEERFDEVSDTLKRMGYNIKSTESTSKTSKTTIINRNNAPENITEDIKNVLKIGNILQGDSSNNIDITIIVGEDILKKLED